MKRAIPRAARSAKGAGAALIASAACAAVAALLFVFPPWAGLSVAGAVFAAYGCVLAANLIRLRSSVRDLEAKRRTVESLRAWARSGASPKAAYERHVARVHEALRGGFPDSAREQAKQLASDSGIPFEERFALMDAVLQHHIDAVERPEPGEQLRFDVAVISHFGLPGGNTSANVADIKAMAGNGLKVGLLHHTVFRWGPDAPLDPRIEDLIDGDRVVRIGLHDRVTCDLAIVRLPTVLLKPLEQRPRIDAEKTVIIANQTPFKFYGAEGPREVAWDIATAADHLREWLGDHTWYAGGPVVHDTLVRQHAEEMSELELAFMPWNECIDADEWRIAGRRRQDGRIRLGRHSRDHKLKWPEDPATLLSAYPDRSPFEVHVLGGADTPRRILGEVPENWVIHPFNSKSAREFLGEIDIFAYYISSDGMEAFGRAPLEAMAAGVPVIMDPRFEQTFGPAAVYCPPAGVAAAAERLMADPRDYAAQQGFAWDFIEKRFSQRTLMERLSMLGVGPRAPIAEQREGDADC